MRLQRAVAASYAHVCEKLRPAQIGQAAEIELHCLHFGLNMTNSKCLAALADKLSNREPSKVLELVVSFMHGAQSDIGAIVGCDMHTWPMAPLFMQLASVSACTRLCAPYLRGCVGCCHDATLAGVACAHPVLALNVPHSSQRARCALGVRTNHTSV